MPVRAEVVELMKFWRNSGKPWEVYTTCVSEAEQIKLDNFRPALKLKATQTPIVTGPVVIHRRHFCAERYTRRKDSRKESYNCSVLFLDFHQVLGGVVSAERCVAIGPAAADSLTGWLKR